MTRRVFILLVVAHLLALGGLHAHVKHGPDQEQVKMFARLFSQSRHWLKRYAPEFELELLDGTRFSLAENIGKKVVVLNFFTTWCAPCKEEMPELSRYYLRHRNEPFVLVGIDKAEETGEVARFVAEARIAFPVGIDRDQKVLKAYGVESFPQTVVIGVGGRIWLYEVGPIANAEVALDRILSENKKLLAKGAVVTLDGYRNGLKDEEPIPPSFSSSSFQAP